jgi:hypothetical protein
MSAADNLFPPTPQLSTQEIVCAHEFSRTGQGNPEMLQRPAVAARVKALMLQRWGNHPPRNILHAFVRLGVVK